MVVRLSLLSVGLTTPGNANSCRPNDPGRLSATLNGQLSLKNCPLSVVMGCHVENFTAPTRTLCRRGIVIEGGGCATIMSNRIVGVGVAVSADAAPIETDCVAARWWVARPLHA